MDLKSPNIVSVQDCFVLQPKTITIYMQLSNFQNDPKQKPASNVFPVLPP